jgi:hypothetical protein
LPCNPCGNTPGCRKKFPAECVIYTGPNLDAFGLTTGKGLSIATILAAINVVIGSTGNTSDSILTALNDINNRLNEITGETHAPYQI